MHKLKNLTRVQRSNLTKTSYVCEAAVFYGCKGGKRQFPQKLTGQAVETKWVENTLYVDHRPRAKVRAHRVLGSKKPMFDAAVVLNTGQTTTRMYKTKASVRKAAEALLGLTP